METIKSYNMKKLLLFITLIGIGAIAGAQVSPHALGVRLYGGDTFSGAELSFQKGLNDRNRLGWGGALGLRYTW